MKKVIRLTESDLIKIVKRVIREQEDTQTGETQGVNNANVQNRNESYWCNNFGKNGFKGIEAYPELKGMATGDIKLSSKCSNLGKVRVKLYSGNKQIVKIVYLVGGEYKIHVITYDVTNKKKMGEVEYNLNSSDAEERSSASTRLFDLVNG